MVDYVPLDLLGAGTGQAQKKRPGGRRSGHLGFKALVALFVLFVLVVSDVFTSSVVAGFRGAVRGRAPTAYGVVLQGIFLVIFYAFVLYLLEARVL